MHKRKITNYSNDSESTEFDLFAPFVAIRFIRHVGGLE